MVNILTIRSKEDNNIIKAYGVESEETVVSFVIASKWISSLDRKEQSFPLMRDDDEYHQNITAKTLKSFDFEKIICDIESYNFINNDTLKKRK